MSQATATSSPLAERMRPTNLDGFIGQEHLVGIGAVLRNAIETGHIPSMILWGPPGVGKTTLANIISETLERPFYSLSAINSGVKDVREVIERAKKAQFFGTNNAILFIDEIHRFSKSQQDSLLGAVEQGVITLIGATTENPSFEVISALLSRCQVYVLKSLEVDDLKRLMAHALENDGKMQARKVQLDETDALLRLSGCDARKLLNTLELVVDSVEKSPAVITNKLVMERVQQNPARYDKTGEQHYDIISAFIKSIRGSDPNAALYWLARMTAGGEDPKFIARRLLILASEDIGNANPTALVIATNAFQAVSVIGYPECELILAQAVVYLASCEKSNASYKAIKRAGKVVAETGDLPVPIPLRNSPTRLMRDLGYGKEYQYAHDGPGNFIAQEYMPDALQGQRFYEPGNNARENAFRQRLKALWNDKYGY